MKMLCCVGHDYSDKHKALLWCLSVCLSHLSLPDT